MGRQIESDSVCRSDCPEYKIGESFSIGDFSYTIVGCTDGIYEAELSKCSNKKIQTAVLSEYIMPNCRLVSIGKYVFYNCVSLTSVIIPSSITSICSSAFNGCTSLTSVIIPSGVTSIEFGTFSGCTSLVSVTIPPSVTSIDYLAFIGCTSLKSIIVDKMNCHYSSDSFGVLFNKNKTILIKCPEGFEGKYIIPSSVTSIGDSAFEKCIYLTSVTIPSGVTSIGRSAFEECISLTSVTIPSGVTSIKEAAFYECTSLTSVIIPSGVTSIEFGTFSECASLKSIIVDKMNCHYSSDSFGVLFNKNKTILIKCPEGFEGKYIIPSSVVSLDIGAFSRCMSLTSVTMPSSITSIEESVFSGCTSLVSVTIPSCVTYIGRFAFKGCTSLTSVTIPFCVTYIGHSAFKGCTSLVSVTIPSGVTSIKESVFKGCTSLTSVTISSGVTSIGEYAFSGCTSLASVTIPSSVTSIDNFAFQHCNSLCNISVNPNNKYYSSGSDVLFNKDKTKLIFCSRCKKGIYLIPETVKIINHDAFSDCSELKSIIMPSNVSEIEGIDYFPFKRCCKLEQIIVSENNIVYSTDDAGVLFDKEKTTLFYCPNRLSGDYTVPDTVKTMMRGCFKNCYRLKTITIPSSVSYNSNQVPIFYKEDGYTVVESDNLGGFRYVFDGEKFIRDSVIVKYTVDKVKHTDFIKLRKE